MHKELGAYTARTDDSNRPKRYSGPYDIILSVQSGGRRRRVWVCPCSAGEGWAPPAEGAAQGVAGNSNCRATSQPMAEAPARR